MKILIGFCLSLVVTSCSFFTTEEPLRKDANLLTEEHAIRRKNLISNVDYQLYFDLTEKDNFQGTTAIHFQMKKGEDITVDFSGGELHEVLVNGELISSHQYNGHFISIPGKTLKTGFNSLLVKYSHPYSKNGAGLYKYVDPKDNRTYIYSHFEPYNANKMFPCFDQPNLKATYSTRALVPKGWQVISSKREQETLARGEFEEWIFPKSHRFSTYTYSLHAGEYFIWEDVAKTPNQEIPLRLFARQSLAPYVKIDDWFSWTKQGFVFFEDYFSSVYPYEKYDQLLVPDFNHGAMENVAAVTFNEDRYVARGEKTRSQRRRLALTLYHEMAHMWFGNLVTMDWWNDLWLNESFATHSSYAGVTASTEFEEAWETFNTYNKQSAYKQDRSISTHPIAQNCAHTDAAFANFDSITYGKGASVLKQLSYFLGEKAYRKGLKNYFQKYANQNTKLDHFMLEMENASGRNLVQWRERWLKTAMLNDMEVFFTCDHGKIKSFEIFQSGTTQYPTLRSHKTLLTLLKKRDGLFKVQKALPIEYSGERTSVSELIGYSCPDIVYPNYKDYDYTTVALDKKSFQNIANNLVMVQDPFLRSLVWSDLWNMVLSQKITMSRFLEITEYNGLVETDLEIVTKVFSYVAEILKKYYPDSGQPWVSQREVWVKFFEQAYIAKIEELTQYPEAQKIWYGHLVNIAESEPVLRLLEKVIKNHRSGLPLSFNVDQDMRWEILAQLSTYGYPGTPELIVSEREKDSSKRGKVNSLFAESLLPDIDKKQELYAQIIAKKNTESFGMLRAIMFGLFPDSQKSLHKKFVDSFYATLESVNETSDEYFTQTFVKELVPTFCDQKSSTQISNFLKADMKLSFPVVKALKEALFENQRCYEMRKILKSKTTVKVNEV